MARAVATGRATEDKRNAPASRHASSWISRLLMASAVGAAIGIVMLVPSEANRVAKPTSASLFPSTFRANSGIGDRVYDSAKKVYAMGRWQEPVEQLQFHIDEDWKLQLQSFFSNKYWHYHSVDSPYVFLGAAVVKLGYANDAFLYVVDKQSPEMEKYEWQGRLPLDLGITFGVSSLDTSRCTSFTAPMSSDFVSFCYDSARKGWHIRANITVTGAIHGQQKRFTADVWMARDEALTLLFPVGNDTMRPAYVHKGAGSAATGTFELDGTRVDLGKERALAAIDWTRSMTMRCTRWKWASSNFHAHVTVKRDGKTVETKKAAVGINFSKDVYDIDGASQENAVWIDGKVYTMRGVDFEIPSDPQKDKWHVVSMGDSGPHESVQLSFAPKGSREDHTNLLVIESDFIQPYGYFDGSIRFTTAQGDAIEITVKKAFGVVENHYALW